MRAALRRARDEARRQRVRVERDPVTDELPAAMNGVPIRDCRPNAPGWQRVPGRGLDDPLTRVLAYRSKSR